MGIVHRRLPGISMALAGVLALTAGSVGEAAAQSRVGVAGAVNPQSQFDRPSGVRTVVIGDDVLFKDRIITGGIGLVQVLFVDGSTFTVGPTARVVIDEFVFNPSDSSGSLVAEVTSGALRFVGGKLSKRGNTVRFRTPGGTLGVRGGIVNIDLVPPCLPDGRCPTQTASFVFGDELTLELPDGGRRRIHQAGYTFAFFGDPNNPSVEIMPTDSLDLNSLQARLSGRPGASGGSPNIPTDVQVAESGVPAVNSARAPIVVLPRPKPVVVVSRYTPELIEPGITSVTNVLDDTVVETSQSDYVRTDVVETLDPVTPPGPVPGVNGVAGWATPEVFVTDTDVRIENPSDTGLIEVVDLAPFDPRFETTDGETELVIGQDRLPFPDELGETAIQPFNSKTLIGVRSKGTVVRGPDDFALYYLQELNSDGEDGPDRVLYLVSGDPTPRGAILSTDPDAAVSVRSYSLTNDFQKEARGIRSELRHLNPVVAREFGNSLAAAVETPYLIATPAGEATTAQTLYGGLLIKGQGAAQRSAIDVDAGFVSGEGKGVALVGFRRGTYRLASDLASAAMSGPTGTLANASGDDFSSMFGKNGESFVYTSGIEVGPKSESGKLFFDRQRGDGVLARPDEFYSTTTTTARLRSTTPGSALTRQSRTLTGFAAGMMESSAQKVRSYRSNDVGDFTVSFDAEKSTLGGVIRISDIGESDPVVRGYQLAFGTDIFGGKASTTRGSYIDDDNFGAVATGPSNRPGSPQTTLTTDTGQVIRHTGSTPDTYMISADAVPQPQLFADAGVTECECRFLEWGWWGTATDFSDDELSSDRRDFAHLGTWVAGDVTPAVDLPTTGTGSYQGHVVGSVVSTATDGTRNRYVAAGSLDVEYDFGARAGRMEVTNFDGRDFSGRVAGGVGRDGVSNQFSGRLSGSDLEGQARGAFVRGPRGPAQGVIGAFDVRGDKRRYRAVGNFMGERIRRGR